MLARLRAIYELVEETGHGARFDWFVLSDTTDPAIWIAEEKCFLKLRQDVGSAAAIFYRHRPENTARKSGNIEDWVRRFGANYECMLILDADSLMTGDSVVRLVAAMEAHPKVALIQTLPIIVNAKSLFARWQQFAGRLYGPLLAAGIAWWHGSEGNYWGHNAIIRVRAFAQYAGLPELRGRKPFGGHIMSHDFIEAALMRRGGWAIHMAPTLQRQLRGISAHAVGFRRPRPALVPGQSAASGAAADPRLSLGIAASSADGNRIVSHRAALADFSRIRNPGLAAGAVRPARIFPEGIFAVSAMAGTGSGPGGVGVRRHDGHADRAETSRLHRAADRTATPARNSAAAFACWPASSPRPFFRA